MTKKALLITGQESETVSTLARNLIHVGGLSLFARQMMQMKSIGIEEMHVVTDWFAQDFEKEILSCPKRPEKIYIHTTKDAPLRLLEHNNEGNSWFLIEEGVIIDDRIIKQADKHPSPSVISMIGHLEFLEERTANGILLQLEDIEGFFGSIAKLSSGTLAANIRKLNSLDGLPNALKAISRASDCEVIKVIDIPTYLTDRNRQVDIVWLPVIRREDGDKGTEILLEYAQKNAQDWVARLIHRHIENFIVKYLCKCPISPNHVTAAAGILGFYAMYLFWSGYMLPALFGAYAVGILYGVDDKLSRVKMIIPRFEGHLHLLGRGIEFGWYFTIAAYLTEPFGLAPSLMALALVLFRLADEIQCEFFRRMTNSSIYNISTFDRKFQLIAGRRNTQMWALLPFALYGQWYMGLGLICGYGIVTFFVHQARLVYHLKNLMIENSEIFAENFKKTNLL